jgi:GTP-binding protein
MKKIALIGKPNVGKSSLFNRLTKQRDAITSDVSGTTRDFKKKIVYVDDREAELVDTGGLDDSNEIFQNIKTKSLQMAKEADIILYMVDGKLAPDEEDRAFFYDLQKLGKDIALVINKLDNDKERDKIWDFYSFGVDNTFGISVSHNRNLRELKNWLYALLPTEESEYVAPIDTEETFDDFLETIEIDEDDNITVKKDEVEDNKINIAIIGKVNVGKSSLLNRLTGEERSVVSSIAGTTIDPVDESITYEDKTITFVDTAGIRRRGKIEGIEKYALMRTESMLERANLAIVVLDASCEFADLDEKIAGLVDKHGLGVIVVFNKWDENLHNYKEAVEKFRYRFKFLYYAPVIAISAKTGRGIDKLKEKILEVYENFSQRVSTSKLNELIKEAQNRHHIPSQRGKVVKIYFATQFDVKPPRIALISNRPSGLHFSYKRYLVNFLRDNFNFEGSPIHFATRKKGERVEDDDIKID